MWMFEKNYSDPGVYFTYYSKPEQLNSHLCVCIKYKTWKSERIYNGLVLLLRIFFYFHFHTIICTLAHILSVGIGLEYCRFNFISLSSRLSWVWVCVCVHFQLCWMELCVCVSGSKSESLYEIVLFFFSLMFFCWSAIDAAAYAVAVATNGGGCCSFSLLNSFMVHWIP